MSIEILSPTQRQAQDEKRWLDELFSEIPETTVTDTEIDDMYHKAGAQGITQPDWTIGYSNGQTVIEVNDIIIGRIWTLRDDNVWDTLWTHNEAPKIRGSVLGRKYWNDRDACITDLVNRYHARLAKRQPVQFIDGSYGYANPEDVDFINWIIDRNRGGY